jgi:glycosyltransferase involved in cell wall biosynthesis
VYQDGPFARIERQGQERLAPDPVDAPFLRFVTEVAEEFGSFAVFARIVESESGDGRPLLPERTRIIVLPDYGSLRQLGGVLRAGAGTVRAFWHGLSGVDVVWAFGPHPFELLLVVLARLRGRRVVLGVRQDTPAYFRARLPSGRWKPVLAGVAVMDRLHRALARRYSATVVGEGNRQRYARDGARVLDMKPTLVAAADVVDGPTERDWTRRVELLTVGRIDPEKNPLLLVEAIAELERRRPGRFVLRWIGIGPMAADVERRAEELAVADSIELVGYVPYGPQLLDAYRNAHAFVHVSLTEGVPQVLAEALASGAPVVATDVGGVRAALDDGAAGLLVPPADVHALVAAVLRLADDVALRDRLVHVGLALARSRTIEAEAARVAEFLHGA